MFEVGCVLNDRYRVVRLLGTGGMARVFEVENLRLPSRAALKVLNRLPDGAEEILRRFRREAEIQARLNHPNLVRVFDWDVTAEQDPYLIMELLQGEDLAQRLRREGALSLPVAISIFTQTAAALEHAHTHGIIHRDLKPGNIFLWAESVIPNHVKVLDFGIAKITGQSDQAETQDAGRLGTPGYMAPEHIRGNTLSIGPKSDQWALALVLYEMLSGRPAFYRRGDEFFQTCQRILAEDPEPLPNAAMNAVVMQALCKEPGGRYSGLSEFVAAVQSCVSQPLYLPVLPAQTARLPEVAVRRSTPSAVGALSPPASAGLTLQAAVGQTSPSDGPEAGGAVAGRLRRHGFAYRLLSLVVAAGLLTVGLGLVLRTRSRAAAPSSHSPGPPATGAVPSSLGLAKPTNGPLPMLGQGAGAVVTEQSQAAIRLSPTALPAREPGQSSGAESPAHVSPKGSPRPVRSSAADMTPVSSDRGGRGASGVLWKLVVLDGVPSDSRTAARLRTCLRGSGLLEARDSPWQRHGQGDISIVNQAEILTLDAALKVPAAIRKQTNACLGRISWDMAIVPDQVSIAVRRG